MGREYLKPSIVTEQTFETSALSCGKSSAPLPGSWHLGSAYDTFTGHFGPGLGGNESVSGSIGIGYGPGGTSQSYPYSGICGNWISYTS